MAPGLLFVVGASGVGKTAVAKVLEARALGVDCYFFDSIGVPSLKVMEREFGGGENWQAVATAQWVERLVERHPEPATIALLEGQTRPSFLRPALEKAGVRHSRIVLLDCDPAVRAQRLSGPRGQPELATPRMDGWAIYLRGQADALGLPVVDTSRKSLDEVADVIQEHLASLRAEVGAAQGQNG